MSVGKAIRKNVGFLVALGAVLMVFYSITIFPVLKDLVGSAIGGIVGLYAAHEANRYGEHYNVTRFTPDRIKEPEV